MYRTQKLIDTLCERAGTSRMGQSLTRLIVFDAISGPYVFVGVYGAQEIEGTPEFLQCTELTILPLAEQRSLVYRL